MPELSPNVRAMPPSGVFRIHHLMVQLGEPMIRLHVGEPGGRIAEHIAAAAKAAWDRDDTDYTTNAGIRPLREAFAARVSGYGRPIDPADVWVTNGATHAVYQAVGAVASAGGEVLIPDPGYPIFNLSTRYHGAEPVRYALRPEAGFQPEIAVLEALVTPRTRAIVVNSPSNPLGTVLTESLALELLAFARRHDLWVVSDEVYEALTWGVPHVSLTGLDTDGRVLGAFSLSKTYAMTGIRVGALVVPPAVSPAIAAEQDAVTACINTPAQYAGIAALTGPQDHVEEARAHYVANLAASRGLLEAKGLDFIPALGAFYLWIDLRHATDGDVATWAERFLRERRVAVSPGTSFGPAGEGWIRVCYAGETEELLAGLRALPSR